MEERYNHLNRYYKEKFGERTLKICVDGGFTCPNRDGTKGKGGCIFCGERGSGEHLRNISIEEQIQRHLDSYRGKRANKFILYFQNFSNTYGSISNLKAKYDVITKFSKIVGLDIDTRPDCINEEIASLIASYKENYYTCVELGLQTSNDNTGKLINRCYNTSDFTNAVKILNNYNIDVIAHIMIGLPGEDINDLKNTIDYLNTLNIQGLKIHSTYIIKDTKLEEMYNNGYYSPITLDYYLDSLTYVITHIKKNVIIHRISGDAPKDILVAPSWNAHKKLVLNGLDKKLRDKDLYQGKYYLKNN